MTTLLTWLVVMELSFVSVAVLAGSLQMGRRPHFWLRYTISLLGSMLALALLAGSVMLGLLPESLFMPLWLVLAAGTLGLALRFCYRTAGDPSSGASEGDDGGALPSDRPSGPSPGGLLLPDADQAAVRVRDHSRPRLIGLGPRRPTPEPKRVPGADPGRRPARNR
jgi:hypothetical protein